MKILNDPCAVEWVKNLNPQTAKTYLYGLNRFCEFTGKSPSVLIDEARTDYTARVEPWNLRHIKLIEGFVVSLNDGMANWTKKMHLKGVKSFYKIHKIPVVGLTHASIPSMPTESYLDTPVLKLEDVRRAVNLCGANRLLKALILTFLSSGQGQAEVEKLKGKHLKNVVNGIAVVNMTRGKTNTRYTFFIGTEALEAIKEYKPKIEDDEFVFTQIKNKKRPLYVPLVGAMFAAHAIKLGVPRGYFAPHRFRHFFKTQLTEVVDARYVEYWMGHKLSGVESNYFIGAGVEERMLQAYIKGLGYLTVFTDKETLQKQYDELKKQQGADGLKKMQEQMARLERAVIDSRSDMLRVIKEELGLSSEQIPDQLKIHAMLID